MYESAIKRLPASEAATRDGYARRLRVVLNRLAYRTVDLEAARSILFGGELAAAPDVYSFTILASKAPDYEGARAVLDEMREADVAPNDFTATSAAKHIVSPAEASELRSLLRERNVAGNNFHRAIYSKLCRSMSGKELLDWAFGDGGVVPFAAFDTAISRFRRYGKLDDALRIASAFPYLDVCRAMFRDEPDHSLAYFEMRFQGDKEPQNAAYALAVCYEEFGYLPEALHWLEIARGHAATGEKKRQVLQKEIDRLNERESLNGDDTEGQR